LRKRGKEGRFPSILQVERKNAARSSWERKSGALIKEGGEILRAKKEEWCRSIRERKGKGKLSRVGEKERRVLSHARKKGRRPFVERLMREKGE